MEVSSLILMSFSWGRGDTFTPSPNLKTNPQKANQIRVDKRGTINDFHFIVWRIMHDPCKTI